MFLVIVLLVGLSYFSDWPIKCVKKWEAYKVKYVHLHIHLAEIQRKAFKSLKIPSNGYMSNYLLICSHVCLLWKLQVISNVLCFFFSLWLQLTCCACWLVMMSHSLTVSMLPTHMFILFNWIELACKDSCCSCKKCTDPPAHLQHHTYKIYTFFICQCRNFRYCPV